MNTSKTVLATLLAALAVAPLAVTPVHAQIQAQASHFYTQAELDQMLAPIALYPDALLSQVLMAATYPIEVVEAARWSRANSGLQGDDAVRAVENEDWDPSVKSLVAVPQILQRMDEQLEWTRTLGDAFLAQEPQMMDQVQRLRQRAQAAGHLRSDERIRVERQGPVIVLLPASPEYLYVPYYDPLEVYGTWWWPSYRPVAWAPWPDYARPYYRPGYSAGFWWGRPVGLSIGFFFGDFDWRARHVRVAHADSYYYRQPAFASRGFVAERDRWQHDPQHRRAVAYRSIEVRQRFAGAQLERPTEQRGERQAARQQLQPAAVLQAQPQAVAPAQRVERREDRREDRRAERHAAPAVTPAQPRPEQRGERQAARQQLQPAAVLQAQPLTVAPAQRVERREDRREDRRAERHAAPEVTPAQPRPEQRDDRRADRRAAEAQRQAQQQAHQQAQDAQRQAQQQARQAQEAQRRAQQQARPPQPAAATMPAAQAPQTPRAERQEQREERREKRKEQREQKG